MREKHGHFYDSRMTRGNKMLKSKNLKRNLFIMPALTGIILAVLVLFQVNHVQAATKIKGIDVSKWQGTVDWKKVKEDGIEFVMLGTGRYRDGVGIPDPKFEYNIKNAIANDIKVGIYLYSEALTVKEAQEEAQYVLEQIDGYKISYPVAFDIEDASQRKLTNKERTDITIAFLTVIEEAGYYPMVYASESWLNDSMDLSRLTKYDKWVARWASSVDFKPLSMWQYSATGRVKGIAGDVDLDYSYKDYSKIITPRTTAKKTEIEAGWKTDGKNHWYVKADGSLYKDVIVTIEGKRYYFDSNGYRVTGWKQMGNSYYFFGTKTGAMQTGWLKVSGRKYYLDPKTGARKTGWITVNKNTYYMNSRGVMQKGWITVDDQKYYLNSSGVLQKGWIVVNKKKYYMNAEGAMQTGWITVGKSKYYMQPNGVLKTGWLTLNGKKYFLKLKTGKMTTGWLTYKKKTYYFNTKTGAMRKGWLTLSGKKYYLGTNGVRVTKWKKISGKWYYFGPKTGAMQKNMKVGKYKLGKDGVCINRK